MNIKQLVDKYKLTKNDVWDCHGNWIVSHDAIEKIAVIEGIEVANIQVLNSERDFVRLLVTATKDKKKVMTIGEADSKNCKNIYYGCMAEKRGIDRAVLKLIEAYQYGIYSDTEADSFKKNKETT